MKIEPSDEPPIDAGLPNIMRAENMGAIICTREMTRDSVFMPISDHAMAQFQEAALKTRYGHRLCSSTTNTVIRVLCLSVILDLMAGNYLNAVGETWVMRLIGKGETDDNPE